MQLLAQTDAATSAPEAQGSPQSQSASEGDAPVSPSSPSSKSNAAPREKPVKVLPCPRCESMNTKFCYYNNYSVAQPRHFCRQCQRYWTAGGTLRNVPVGGGSRKKNRQPRGGEPYLQRPHGTQSGPFGLPPSGAQSGLPNGTFQQMLTQDMVALNFAQVPVFPPPGPHFAAPYALQDPNQGAYGSMMSRSVPEVELPPHMHAMYGSAPISPGGYYVQEMAGAALPADSPVKPEFWPPAPQRRFDSSMLLNLGLNNGLPSQGTPVAGNAKNGSPPHGSSTVEDDGSTPTNGHSNGGFEDGDTESSMWHSLHDDNMFQDSMFQLNGEDRC